MPESASSIFPFLCDTAPVKDPFRWPKSSDSRSSLGIAPQLIATKGLSLRGLLKCIEAHVPNLRHSQSLLAEMRQLNAPLLAQGEIHRPFRMTIRQCCTSRATDRTSCPSLAALAGTFCDPFSSSRTARTCPALSFPRAILVFT